MCNVIKIAKLHFPKLYLDEIESLCSLREFDGSPGLAAQGNQKTAARAAAEFYLFLSFSFGEARNTRRAFQTDVTTTRAPIIRRLTEKTIGMYISRPG